MQQTIKQISVGKNTDYSFEAGNCNAKDTEVLILASYKTDEHGNNSILL